MRAKYVNTKAYIFDWDDTLVKTDAKTKVYKNGKFLKFLTADDFNRYQKAPDEVLDLSDFNDPRFIITARKFKMWPALHNISTAVKQGRSKSDIFILTARNEVIKSSIENYLMKNGIVVTDVITIGDNKGEIHIPTEKKKILKDLKSRYDEIVFFDDNPENIQLASEIGGIRTRLIDGLNI